MNVYILESWSKSHAKKRVERWLLSSSESHTSEEFWRTLENNRTYINFYINFSLDTLAKRSVP